MTEDSLTDYAVPVTLYRCPPCMLCGRDSVIDVPTHALEAWQGGELIQNAMPEMAPAVREQMVSGTHATCWERLMGDE